MDWNEIIIKGLTAKDGSEYVIRVGKPFLKDETYACRVIVPGIVNKLIIHESSLSAIASSISLVERLVYEPSVLLMAETTLTQDHFPDLDIQFTKTEV